MVIGKIISVEYDRFRIKLFHTTKTSAISLKGRIYYFGNIGSYVKTSNTVGDSIICEVVAILDNNTNSDVFSSYNLDSARELVIKPMGTLSTAQKFNLGVGIFPSIYSDVSIVTVEDVNKILAQDNDSLEYGKAIHKDFEIGNSKNLINYRIKINIDNLFNIHTAVLGNSGSGKSNTIAHIIQQIYRKSDNYAIGAKTIIFDVNGEYKKAFVDLNDNVKVEFFKPNIDSQTDAEYRSFHLPYYLLNLDEWLAFLMASERTQKPFWDRVLQECFKFYRIFLENSIGGNEVYSNYFIWKIKNILINVISKAETDTAKMTAAQGVVIKCKEIVSTLDIDNDLDQSELLEFLEEVNNRCRITFGNNDGKLSSYLNDKNINVDLAIATDKERLRSGEYFDYNFLKVAVDIVLLEEEAKGNSRIREFTSTMLTRLDYFLYNSDCDFMRNTNPSITEQTYLNDYFGISETLQQNQLIVIDSSEVGTEILELLTSVVSRIIFDYRKRRPGEERRKAPVHLILDEAHRYIKKDSFYILRENIFERIAREGRKFSLYLMLSSQRPSELSDTVLSQCGNYIIHRIQNEVDMKFIYSVLPFFSDYFTSKIKQAVPGEALIFGNCVPMPLLVSVDLANPKPNSENCLISKEWFTIVKKEGES